MLFLILFFYNFCFNDFVFSYWWTDIQSARKQMRNIDLAVLTFLSEKCVSFFFLSLVKSQSPESSQIKAIVCVCLEILIQGAVTVI